MKLKVFPFCSIKKNILLTLSSWCVTHCVISTLIYGLNVQHECGDCKLERYLLCLLEIELESTPQSQAVFAFEHEPLNQPITVP